VRFVDGEDDVAVALVGLGGERGLDLRDEGRVVETGCLPECQGDGPVDSPDADLGVGEVDEGVAGGVQAVDGGAEGGGLAGPDFSGDDAQAAEPRRISSDA